MQLNPVTKTSLLLVSIAAFIAGCDTRPDPTPAQATPAPATSAPVSEQLVKIDNFTFSPATLTITAGTTVKWVNGDDVPHTVTADDRSFTSKALDTDDAYSHAFTTPGTYPYFCAVHSHMTGTIIVKPSNSGATNGRPN